MASPSRFELSALDNVLPRYFHSGIWALRLRDGVTHNQVVTMLRESLESASTALPLLRRRAFSIPPSRENPTTGRLEAREHADWTPVVDCNDLSDTWPDYDELMEEGLPQDMLDGAQLLPSGRIRIDLDDAGTPLLVAQANFVAGGLLLGISMFHALIDGMSMALIFRAWAQHMRVQQGQEAWAALETVVNADCCNYNTLVDVWKGAGSPVAEATPAEWRLLGLLPPRSEAAVGALQLPGSGAADAPAANPPPPMSTGIFYVPAGAISRLSAIATAANEPGATANDALMALVWRCTMRARRAAAPEKPCYSEPGAMTEMDTTLNGRALLGDLLPWQYMGSLVFFTTRLTVEELVASSTRLETVVGAVRRAVASVTQERALAAYGLAATKLPHFTAEALQRPMPTFDGAEFGVTSLMSLPIMDWSFGNQVFANGGIPDYIRQERRLFDRVCRYCSVGPLRREGGVEVLVSLAVDEMTFLELDSEFAEFAQLLCH
jgi:trichothecene 3-O-acetyltransferase